jgi:hypothetical protein
MNNLRKQHVKTDLFHGIIPQAVIDKGYCQDINKQLALPVHPLHTTRKRQVRYSDSPLRKTSKPQPQQSNKPDGLHRPALFFGCFVGRFVRQNYPISGFQ